MYLSTYYAITKHMYKQTGILFLFMYTANTFLSIWIEYSKYMSMLRAIKMLNRTALVVFKYKN